MDIPSSTILEFNGHDYKLRAVLGGWDQYPDIVISSSELNDLNLIEFEPHVSPVADTGMKVLLFKQNNKYTVLVGREIVLAKQATAKQAKQEQFTISGKLISTMSLKRARIVEEVEEVLPVAPVVTVRPPPRVYSGTNSVTENRYDGAKPKPRSTPTTFRGK